MGHSWTRRAALQGPGSHPPVVDARRATAPRSPACRQRPRSMFARTTRRCEPGRTMRADRRGRSSGRMPPRALIGSCGPTWPDAHGLLPQRPRRQRRIPLNTCYVAPNRDRRCGGTARSVAQLDLDPGRGAHGSGARRQRVLIASLRAPSAVYRFRLSSSPMRSSPSIAESGRRGEAVQETLDDIAARHLGLARARAPGPRQAGGPRRRESSLSRSRRYRIRFAPASAPVRWRRGAEVARCAGARAGSGL